MMTFWKDNWDETRGRFRGWWRRTGLLVSTWGEPPRGAPHIAVDDPGRPRNNTQRWADAPWRARAERHALAYQDFPLEKLPLADTTLGPGSLSLMLGAQPEFAETTVWFRRRADDAALWAPLAFDRANRWWKLHRDILEENLRASRGQYLVPCPDLVENLDVLASLRGTQQLMIDLLVEPAWVQEQLWRINDVFFEVYEEVYSLIRAADGGSSFYAFSLWAPGKMAKVQADASALISPGQFEEFVLPPLAQQCQWLDFSLFHVDGTQCLRHLDFLLGLEKLDAVEFTPEPGQPSGGSPRWYELYRKILAAGKSVQAVDVRPEEVAPLLHEIGTQGVYLIVNFTQSSMPLAEFQALVRSFRG
ncbi:MAG: hypothetical protein NTZ09_07330 [Candidatus Hydrogenedentes bacterium]|nr:hypothetical protein [Candidatus Hydrogenedentota bacterium]